MAAQRAGAARALRGRRPRARRGAPGRGAYERYLRIGAAYGALGDLDAAIVGDRERLERGLWTGEPLARAAPGRRAAGARRAARCAGPSPTDRDHAAGLRDPRARDPRGRAARHAQRRRRALQRRGRARDRRLAGGHRRRGRHAARRCSPSRGALAPIETGLLRLRRELAAIRRAHGGAGRRSTRSAARERQRLNGRLGAGLEILAQRPARARDAAARPRSRSCGREARPPPLPHPLGARARRRRRRRGRRRVGRGGAAPAAPRDALDERMPVRRAAPGRRPDRAARRRRARRAGRDRARPRGAQRRRCRRSAAAARELTQGSRMPIGEADDPPLDSGALGTEIAPGRADGDDRLRRTRCSTTATGSAPPPKLDAHDARSTATSSIRRSPTATCCC